MPPAHILVLDDDAGVLALVETALRRDGHEIRTAERPSDALALAQAEAYALVLCDVTLPEMSGFEFRTKLRAIPGRSTTPIVFMSAADPKAELEIARDLGNDRLLLKPIAQSELRREVQVALGNARRDRGQMPEGMDRILADIAANKETGILTAVAGTTLKRVVFHEGKVAFAASNDPREVIGQVFVRSGLVSEKDLAAAFAHRESSGGTSPIGAVLTALRKVTPEQAHKVFEKKIRESVLDLFLWRAGTVEYSGGGLDASDRPFPIALDLPALRVEGLKRRIKWAEVRRLIPDPSVSFERPSGGWPATFPRNEGDRLLAQHLEAGRSMAEILVELRGQDFAVGSRLADLIKAGVLRAVQSSGFGGNLSFQSITIDLDDELAAMEEQEGAVDVDLGDDDILADEPPAKSTRVLASPLPPPPAAPPAPSPPAADGGKPLPAFSAPGFSRAPGFTPAAFAPAPPPPPQPDPMEASIAAHLTQALLRFRGGDLLGARENLVEVITVDPMNALARQRLREVDDALAAEAASSQGLRPDSQVSLAVPLEKLVGNSIPPNDAFVLTRLAVGAMPVSDLMRICPLPENEVMTILQRYLQSGVLKSG